MINQEFWKGKKVLITGHTGFKGSWLSLWLNSLGAEITGFSLMPSTNPNLFNICNMDEIITSVIGDIRDKNLIEKVTSEVDPDIIFHLAAQPLVRESYLKPVETYETNVIGTVNVFESIRAVSNNSKKNRVIVNVTTDKCYENKEWVWGYREHDTLGGYDPYSNSKACSELVTSCYIASYFNPQSFSSHGVALASARAGNVIGGGDWATDRLIPDCIRAILKNEEISLRYPHSIRPWQYVLEPLSGYILLAQKLYGEGKSYIGSWNFGPNDTDVITVQKLVDLLYSSWGIENNIKIMEKAKLHEAGLLKLDCSKAKKFLNWSPKWDITEAISRVVQWEKAHQNNEDMREFCLNQIHDYMQMD